MIERSIATGTHGRYLVAPAAAPGPLLVGFHGYAEAAETQMERLGAIPGAERWTLVSIHGLHRFYQRRSSEVVGSWMTKQDRSLAIADNLAYVSAVVEACAREWSALPLLVFAGFSQGVAMAYRAAAASERPIAGVVSVGGDVPPELDAASLARIGSALVCRGARDDWYTSEKFRLDVDRLQAAGVDVRPLEFEGGHEWSSAVSSAAGQFLRERER